VFVVLNPEELLLIPCVGNAVNVQRVFAGASLTGMIAPATILPFSIFTSETVKPTTGSEKSKVKVTVLAAPIMPFPLPLGF
jgi:hypothetical protein